MKAIACSWLLGTVCISHAAAGTPVVINEVRGSGGDWVELYNPGRTPADISEWRLADSSTDGSPRLEAAVRFPGGTVVPAGGFLLVISDQGGKARAGLQRWCRARGAPPCIAASWGIGRKHGELLRLIAPDGASAAEARYPAGRVPKGRTWARQPDGGGEFAVSTPSPGRANSRGGGE